MTKSTMDLWLGFARRATSWLPFLAAGALATMGCKTVPPKEQFEPVPVTVVETENLEPAAPPSPTEQLRAAEAAFRAANAAQEKGDRSEALRQYTLMLELLLEADLDPAIFYNLRREFGEILSSSAKQALAYERARRPHYGEKEYGTGIAGDLPIEFPLHERILVEIDEIQNLYPKNFQGGLNRSAKYVSYIQEELAKAGLPKDLVWLAMVESQFTPKIISRAGAGGMWQFLTTTGRRYKLRVDQEVDERFDWQKETHVAIGYLKDLYQMFGSWPLAISAYNMGEGGLERAIAANGGERDLWKLLENPPASYQIRLETKKFYAKLLASVIVANSPDRYGFTAGDQSPDNVVRIPVNGRYALVELNKAAGLAPGTLEELNQHLVRGRTPSGPYELVVPAETQATVVAALQTVPQVRYAAAEASSSGGVHVVRSGDTISGIAQKYGVSAKDLMKINKIRSAQRIAVGMKLKLPGGARAVGGSESAIDRSGDRMYKVRPGDSLFDVAKAQGVSVADLQLWNNKGQRTSIMVGETLRLSPPGEAASKREAEDEAEETPAPGTKHVHAVQPGEYPAKIARNHHVRLADLLRWNTLSESATIQVGDQIMVYMDEQKEEAAKPPAAAPPDSKEKPPAGPESGAKRVHKVAKGDYPASIAVQYGIKTQDLLAANGLSSKSILHVGQELVIPASGKGAPASNVPAAKPQGEKITHVVTRGQNPGVIARRYGVTVSQLFEWNGWRKTPTLQVGDKVIVYTNQ